MQTIHLFIIVFCIIGILYYVMRPFTASEIKPIDNNPKPEEKIPTHEEYDPEPQIIDNGQMSSTTFRGCLDNCHVLYPTFNDFRYGNCRECVEQCEATYLMQRQHHLRGYCDCANFKWDRDRGNEKCNYIVREGPTRGGRYYYE
uniref:Uncharacterized protein n=1 Tax=Rhinella marina erythrocytic-like virus TaxID=2859906 RepID=A0A8F6UA96_9VIRU|nr:hypothetical protein RMELV018 [Rhinella marina erythrocytic-like virus]